MLGDRSRYLGPIAQSSKQSFLGDASVFLFPIDWPEPFGLVMIEAMATGTPVVATRFGAAPEIVEDGVTGFVVEPHEMAAALPRALELDRAKVRARFEERFTSARMARDYVELYRRLVAADRGSSRGITVSGRGVTSVASGTARSLNWTVPSGAVER